MARPLVRLAERSPGPVRRSVLRLSLGAPHGPVERWALRTWHVTRPVRQALLPPRRRVPDGAGVVVVDATGLDGPALQAHADAAASALAAGGPAPRGLVWLLSTSDLRPVTSRGWVADHVAAGDADERTARLALLRGVLPAARVVVVPAAAEPSSWVVVLRGAQGPVSSDS